MTQHTALLDLPSHLANLGLNVVALDGWDEAQGSYFWTDPDTNAQSYGQAPSGYMVHHSAGSSATPSVKDSAGTWSKANAWIGLYRGGDPIKLYQEGGGDPLIVLVASGPARVSSGYGYRPAAWDFTFQDRRAPAHATGSDGSTALNRYVVNMETVHRGDGSEIAESVWSHVVGLGIGLHEMFGWNERTLGHTSWTKRKIDPKWSVGLPSDGADAIIGVQDAIADIGPAPDPPTDPIDPPPPTNGADVYLPLKEGDGFDANPERNEDVKWLQRALHRAGLFSSAHGFDGKYGGDTSAGVAHLENAGDGSTYGAQQHDDLLRRAYSNGTSSGYVPHVHDEGTPVE